MRILSILLLSLIITGCKTGYVPANGGKGYSETQLGEDNYQIIFRGNGDTSIERAYDFALLRGAEIALSSGYSFISPSQPSTSQSGSSGIILNNMVMTVNEPEVSINVKLSKTKAGNDCLDAAFIKKSIRAKYELGE